MNRRRFLGLSAAALCPLPAFAQAVQVWQGRALGADAAIRLAGASPAQARQVFRKVELVLAGIEAQFSLHRDSALTRLNRDGQLARPDADILSLFDLAGQVHAATAGVFDPTVQPLYLATARGEDVQAARALVGWPRVRVGTEAIALDPGMALTFNGIAQGAAADRIAALLRAEGFGDVLVDMGEVMALGQYPAGRPWQAAVATPAGAEVARVALRDRALATSSPKGTLIGAGQPHILHPAGLPPLWQLVSVSASTAALADALSTAFCLMDRAAIDAALDAFPEVRLEALV